MLEYLCSEPWSDERTGNSSTGKSNFPRAVAGVDGRSSSKQDSVLIGFFGFGDEIPPEVQMGWRFIPEYWGRGLATEAATAMMQYGFDRFHFTRLVAVAQPANLRSIRLMEKLGMYL